MQKQYNKEMVFTALCASMTAIFSQITIPLPFTPIPITLGLLAVFISGGISPVKWAVLSQFIYICLGILGLPVFAGFTGGLGIISGPTGGFIIGYLFTALVSSFIINKFSDLKSAVLLAMILGLLACYICGTVWFMLYSHANLISALAACVLPFIFGDFVKLFLAFTIVLKLRSYLPVLNA